MTSALVIGGTGPTGPHIVNGLLERGLEVTILHSGMHEVEFAGPVEHIHVDPHFRETLAEGIGHRQWDVAIVTYGRLRVAVEALKGHTGRLIAVTGATGGTAGASDPRWGAMGAAANLDESTALPATEHDGTLAMRIAQGEAVLFEAHAQGHFRATCLAYPQIYGPRQPGALDWAIVRRVLDGRRHFIIADGGHKLETRAYAINAAHAVLLAIDHPDASSGRKYFVADDALHSLRQRIEAIAAHLGYRFELVDMPYEWAVPCHPLWRRTRESRIRSSARIKRELGYADVVSAPEALARTVDWMVAQRAHMQETETQLGDPFDYAREDALIALWQRAQAVMGSVDYPLPAPAHIYRHPKVPGEAWSRPRSEPEKNR